MESSQRSREPLPQGPVRVPDHVVRSRFKSETVILDVGTGQYYSLNPTGTRMLEVLEDAPDAESAARAIAAEFEVPLERVREDLRMLCAALLEKGLIVVGDAPG